MASTERKRLRRNDQVVQDEERAPKAVKFLEDVTPKTTLPKESANFYGSIAENYF